MIMYLSKGRLAENKKFEPFLFYGVAVVLNLLAAVIAFLRLDLDVILSLTGSFGAINLMLTLPFAFYYRLYSGEAGAGVVQRVMIKMCIPGMVFGVALSIVCAYFSLAPLFRA